MRKIVNRKEIAAKNVIAVLRTLFVTMLLLGCPSTLMNVQAASEEQVQQEIAASEAQLESGQEVMQPAESAAEEVQIPPEGAVEEVQTPAEGTAEEVQAQPEGETEEVQPQTEGAAVEPQAQTETAEEAAPAQPTPMTMVGDSVMLGGSPSILVRLPDCVIDAKVSRQFIEADNVLNSLEQQGLLRQTVVIGLGTNGAFSTAKGQELINRLGSERTIYWVTVYGRDLSWQEEANATIRQLAEANENVHIIDWSQAAAQHTEWICADGIHLSAAGREGYAQTVLEGLQ